MELLEVTMMNDLISKLSELRSQYNLFDENEQDAYHTLTEVIAVLNEVNELGNQIKDRQEVRDKSKLRSVGGRCDYCNEDSDGYVKPIEKNCHAFVRFGMDGWELSLKANGWHGSAKIRYCPMCGRDLLVK